MTEKKTETHNKNNYKKERLKNNIIIFLFWIGGSVKEKDSLEH